MEELYEIPSSWTWNVIEDIGKTYSGGTPKTADDKNFDGDIPWVTPADLTGYTSQYISRGRRNISQKGLSSSSAKIVPEGSVLFSSRAPIGYVAIASNPLCTNQGFKSVSPHDGIDSRYIYFYLKAAKNLAESRASGTTFRELSGSRFNKLPLPIAPTNEQKRIVDKIERLFSDMGKGEELLKTVQKQLATYRQSVLKAAVTGELTKDWREQNKHRLESGEKLLTRILESRRKNWKGRGKHKEISNVDVSDFPDLPEGWVWATPEHLTADDQNALCIGPFGSNLKVEDYTNSGVPLIFVRHIRAKTFEGLKPQYISKKKAKELSAHRVIGGDILITKMGEPPGDVCVYPENFPEAIITADCIRLSHRREFIDTKYLELTLSSRPVQTQIQAITKGVAQQKVTLGNFKKIAFPLPGLEEQAEISSICVEKFSQIETLESWCAAELKRNNTLRQSILKFAFSGKLVAQDIKDEPANELLKRIQLGEAGAPISSRGRKSRSNRVAAA